MRFYTLDEKGISHDTINFDEMPGLGTKFEINGMEAWVTAVPLEEFAEENNIISYTHDRSKYFK